jgi:hypothetical protein
MDDAPGTIVAEWQLNRHERMRVALAEFHQVSVIDIRKWFEAEDGSVRPSKRGITVATRHLPLLAEATTKALAVAREQGLIPPGADDSEHRGEPSR